MSVELISVLVAVLAIGLAWAGLTLASSRLGTPTLAWPDPVLETTREGPARRARHTHQASAPRRFLVKIAALPLVLALAVSGCATRGHRHIPESTPITLSKGVQTVVKALDALAKRSPDAPFHGLVPAEVEVSFQIVAGRLDTDEFSINVLPVGDLADIGGKWSTEITRSTGNTITIRFRNILFAKKDEILGFAPPGELKSIFDVIEKLLPSATLTN